MKNWQETRQLYGVISDELAAGRSAVLATIVDIEGSTYRRSGAKLLIRSDRTAAGNVSGGCLEEDVVERAMQVMASGVSARVEYKTGDEEDTVWGMGLGCNGRVDLFLQYIAPGAAPFIKSVLDALDGDEAFAIGTVVTEGAGDVMALMGERVVSTADAEYIEDFMLSRARSALDEGTSRLEDLDESQVFLEVLLPPPHVVVCGAGDDAIPLVKAASEVGFRVTVVDHRSAYLDAGRFPAAHRLLKQRAENAEPGLFPSKETYAVVKTHALKSDKAWVSYFVDAGAPYIGLLGPRARRDEILGSVTETSRDIIYGPVGLDLGAEGPEQVALSVIAEILAAWSGRNAGHLRDRDRAIHDV